MGKSSAEDISNLRYQGWMAAYTLSHRAFRQASLNPAEIFWGVLLTLGSTAGWSALLPRVASLWATILSFWIRRLWPGITVSLVNHSVLARWQVPVPYFHIEAGPITGWTWCAIAAGSSLAFALSYKIPRDVQLPFVYLVRALSLIQWTALAYTGIARRPFPHEPSQYVSGMLLFAMIFIGCIPTVLALTFYVFDVSTPKKFALTLMVMAHLTLFTPLQYLLHACILRVSLLFLPVLYLAFGPLLDVILFIALYSWGMSWSARGRFPLSVP